MSIHPASLNAGLTRAEHVRARAFSLAIETVAGRGHRTFLDVFTRAEEIEAWLYKAQEPRIARATTIPEAVHQTISGPPLQKLLEEARLADRLDPYGT